MKYIVIKADYNDGDYVTSRLSYTEGIYNLLKDRITPALKKVAGDQIQFGGPWNIRDNGRQSFDDESGLPNALIDKYDKLLTIDEMRLFTDLCPTSPDYEGIHTIVSIKVVEEIEDIF